MIASCKEVSHEIRGRREVRAVTDVEKPSPGPGQVLIKIGGAGVCHSDLHVMEEDLRVLAPPILRHRVLTNYQAESDGRTVDDVLREVIHR